MQGERMNMTKIRVLMVCYGNICRSPMSEFVFKDIVKKHGLENRVYIESAATSSEEIGNPVYPPARRELAKHGISCDGKTARQLTRADYDRWDLIIGMEQRNIRNMHRIFGGDLQGKVRLLMEFAGSSEEIADPWYTGDFSGVYEQIVRGCEGLAEEIAR